MTVVTSVASRSAGTKERLLDTAEELFAREGITSVTTRELTAAAGQRNASAISYHFGSRDGLLREVLSRRGGPVDSRRAEMRSELGDTPPLHLLVRCLVEPYAALCTSPQGRSYLRIVAQLRGRFARWRIESDSTTTVHLSQILDEIERRASGADARRRARVVAMIMLITATTAERAQTADELEVPELSHEAFLEELVAMCTAIVTA